MSLTTRLFGLVFSASVISIGCGARLPRDEGLHRPVAVEQAVALNDVAFSDLESGVKITLGTYMHDHGLTHMLITFGSTNCAVCMSKTRYLETNLVGHYDLLGADAVKQFEVKGVNIDPPAKREDVLELIHKESLSHVSWSDPAGDMMMRFFQPAGFTISVPLTVLINTDGIVWRISSKDHVDPDEIIRRVAAKFGSAGGVKIPPPVLPKPTPDGSVPANTPPTVPGNTPPSSQPNIDIDLLRQERPNRLAGVRADVCGRSVARLSEVVGAKGFRMILASRDDCGPGTVCGRNQALLRDFTATCNKAEAGCSLAVLGEKVTTCDGTVWRGGGEFFSAFREHFNWSYRPVSQSGRKIIEEVKGPLTFVFDASGKLVFGQEGELSLADLSSRWQNDHWTSRAKGPDWPLATSTGASSFSSVRARAKYTMTLFWNTWCSSCVEEITAWHGSGSVLEYCRARPEFCQVQSVETGYPESGRAGDIGAYIHGLLHGSPDFDGFDKLKWTIPLAIDPQAPSSEGRDSRWFDGWIRAVYGADPRSVLYDREGKILGTWVALPGEGGPLELLKKLEQSERSAK